MAIRVEIEYITKTNRSNGEKWRLMVIVHHCINGLFLLSLINLNALIF